MRRRRRPAAPRRSTSSSSWAASSGFPSTRRETKDPVEVVEYGIQAARTAGQDVVILDTAGRLHIDEPLMDELARVRSAAKPTNILLVLDAMTGQEAVNVAQAFQEASPSTA